MPRGYRSYIVAAFGFLILAVSPERDARKRNQSDNERVSAQALSDIASTLKHANEPHQTDQGCDQGQDDRRSELCAQWKAADAAEKSANWTIWLGSTGATLGLGTLIAAFFAAYYARNAWIETGRSADAAVVGLGHAQEAANSFKATDRAWMVCEAMNHHYARDFASGEIVGINIEPNWKNVGQSPALGVKVNVGLVLVDVGQDIEALDWGPPRERVGTGTVIGPTLTLGARRATLSLADMQNMQDGNVRAIVTTWAHYSTFYSNKRRLSVQTTEVVVKAPVKVMTDLSVDPEVAFQSATRHNSAT